MADIKIAFWNVENLFDTSTEPSEIALDFDFTPEKGWTQETYNQKLENLAQVISLMHDGQGPDLLGVCEVENRKVLEDLLAKLPDHDFQIVHDESADKRGIDTSLLFRSSVLELTADPISHVIHLRYPTRDIYQVPLKVKANNAELTVFVNHWPSRMKGVYETEPFRIAVAEHSGRLVDSLLKVDRKEFIKPAPDRPTLAQLNAKWDGNVLLMGDFNDGPFSRSIIDYLKASTGEDHLEEKIKASDDLDIPKLSSYLQLQAYLYNCMSPLLGRPDEGTHYFSGGTNTMEFLDQFMVSRGLYFGKAELQFRRDSVAVFKPAVMTTQQKKRPKGLKRVSGKITDPGFSDHFPILGVVETV